MKHAGVRQILLLGVAGACLIASRPPVPRPERASTRAGVTRGVSRSDMAAWKAGFRAFQNTASPAVHYAAPPLAFEPVTDRPSELGTFVARGPGYRVAVESTGLRLAYRGGTAALRLQGARRSPGAGIAALPGKTSYLTGPRSRWRTGVPQYSRVAFRNVYQGIDLLYYGNGNELEYDFVVHPGAQPNTIRVVAPPALAVRLQPGGEVSLGEGGKEIRLRRPYAYQETSGGRTPVEVRYELAQNELRFALGEYDRARTLVIDPVLSYSAVLNGTPGDAATSIALDSEGHIYLAGVARASGVEAMGRAAARGGGDDVFVTKLSADGRTVLYTAYIGGSGEETAGGIAVDRDGYAIVVGSTSSPDLAVSGAMQASLGGDRDAFVARLLPDGSGFAYSTYLGGADDDSAAGVAVGANGTAYITGATSSPGFPLAHPLQPICGRGASGECTQDAFIAALDADGHLTFSTYLGGADADAGTGIAVTSAGEPAVTGTTRSPDFPLQQPLQSACGRDANGRCTTDAFVARLDAGGSRLLYSTYLGGTGDDSPAGIALDASGQAYIGGSTHSWDFPMAGAVRPACEASALETTGAVCQDGFLAVLDATGSKLVFSTYLGGHGADSVRAIAARPDGYVVAAGGTASPDFPVEQPVQANCGGAGRAACSRDAFAAVFAPGGLLVFSTFLGGSANDVAMAAALSASGSIYLAGTTDSNDFPVAGTPTVSATGSSQGGHAPTGFLVRMDDAVPALAQVQAQSRTGPGRAMVLTCSVTFAVASGTWETAANWSPARVPVGSDTACINVGTAAVLSTSQAVDSVVVAGTLSVTSAGTLTLNSGTNVSQITGSSAALNLAGGLAGGPIDANTGGALNWSSGSMSGGGLVSIAADGVFNVSGGVLLNGRALQNGGSGSWTGTGDFAIYNGAVFTNSGTFTVQNDQSFIYNNAYGATINNSGTIVKQTATGITTINGSISLNNTGTVSALTGTLKIQGGGTSSGTFNAASGALVVFPAGHTFNSASFTGAGQVQLSGATYNVSGSISTQNLDFTAGTMSGTASFTGTLTWSGGTMTGGTTTIPSGSVLSVTAAGGTVLSSHTLANQGTTVWSGASSFGIYNGSVVNNSGTFLVQNAQAFVYNNAYGATFNNTGLFRKTSAGTTTVNANIAFNNSGTVDVQAGTLSITGGGTSSGVFNAEAGAQILFPSSHSFTNGASFTGAGSAVTSAGTFNFNGTISTENLRFTGGTLTGAPTFTGTITWSGGTMTSGSTAIPAGALLLIDSAAGVVLSGHALNNSGTVQWTGASDLAIYNGSAINNAGLFLVENAQSFTYNNAYGANINNTGTFKKTSAGTTTANGGVAFNNSGIVDVQAGILSLNGGGSSGNFNTAAGAQTLFPVSHTFTNGASFTGGGSTVISAGTFNFGGTINTENLEFASGTLNGTATFTGTLKWTGGTMSVGNTTMAAGGTLLVSAAAGVVLSGHTLNNAGTTDWTGASNIAVYNGSTINNSGVFLVENAQSFIYNNAYGGFINNSGTFRKTSAGLTSVNGGISFSNSGTVDAQAGTLELAGGGTSTGTFAVALNAAVKFAGGTHDLSSATLSSGDGVLDFSGGTNNLNGTCAFGSRIAITGGTIRAIGAATSLTVDFSAGTLGGGGSFTVTGNSALNWSGGTMADGGSTLVSGGSTLNVSGAVIVSGRTLQNAGGGGWTGTGDFGIYNGGVFTNSGTWVIENDQSFVYNNAYGATFNNSGTLVKQTATGVTNINSGIPFNNSGTVNIQSGTLNVAGGGSSTGTFQAAAGAFALFPVSHSFNGSSFLGAGRVRMTGGTQSVAGSMASQSLELAGATMAGTSSFTGTVTWTAGTITGGATTITAGSTLAVNTSAGVVLSGHTLANQGTTVWSGTGDFGIYNGSVVNNAGTMLVQNAKSFTYNNAYGATINNSGTFRKTVAGTTSVNGGIPFNNSGTVDIQAGVFTVQGGGTSSGTFGAASGVQILFPASHSFTNGVSFTGAGQAVLGNATYNFSGTATSQNLQLAGGTFNPSSATFAGTLSWTGGTFGGGSATIAPGATLTVNSTTGVVLSGTSFSNQGTMVWVGASDFGIYNGAVLNNAGAFLVQNAQSFVYNNAYGATINNSGLLQKTSTGTTSINGGIGFNNSGTIDVQAGLLSIAANLVQTAGATLLNGGAITTPLLNLQGGSLVGAGTLTGSVSNAGAVTPGLPAGTLTITGNYTQTATGVLAVDITSLSQYDLLTVGGTASLAGTLVINRLNGYVPAAGDSFTVLGYAARSGSFSAVAGQDTGGGNSFLLSYGASALALTVSPNPAPVIALLSPAAALAGGADLTLAVAGSNFTSTSAVQWNGSNRATTFVSTAQLNAVIPAADIASPGTANIQVFAPAPGGGTSGQVAFKIVQALLSSDAAVGSVGLQAHIPVRAGLASSADALNFTIAATSDGPAPAITAASFTPNPALPSASIQTTQPGANAVQVNLVASSPLSGNFVLGEFVVDVPLSAADAQTYSVQITGPSATLSGAPLTAAAERPFTTLTVGSTYLIGDVQDFTGDTAGQFGNGELNNLDLIHALRAANGVTGFVPASCSDRFDAMDSAPGDAVGVRGGDGALDINDLVITLGRIANIDPARPRRAPGACLAGNRVYEALGGIRGGTAGRGADARLSLGRPSQLPDGSVQVGVYVDARASLDLQGLTCSVGFGNDGPHVPLRFTPGALGRPSLVDQAVDGVVSFAWLEPLALPEGSSRVIGYVIVPAGSEAWAEALRVTGGVANARDGRRLTIDFVDRNDSRQ